MSFLPLENCVQVFRGKLNGMVIWRSVRSADLIQRRRMDTTGPTRSISANHARRASTTRMETLFHYSHTQLNKWFFAIYASSSCAGWVARSEKSLSRLRAMGSIRTSTNDATNTLCLVMPNRRCSLA